jgi:hypothetical protein
VAVATAGLTLAIASCRDDPTATTAPHRIDIEPGVASSAQVGTTLTTAPSFAVRGADGSALAGVPVTLRVTSGNGRLRNAPRRTAAGGRPTPVGEWTLGTTAGRNTVAITAGSLAPVEVIIDGTPEPPSAITVVSGAAQSGLAGEALALDIAVRVHDRFGNGISGAPVSFTIPAGGGDVAPAIQTADAQGVTGGVAWRLGRDGGAQKMLVTSGALSVVIPAAVRTGFTPVIRFFGTPPAPAIRAAFLDAADRISAAVIGDLDDVPLLNFDLGRCGVQGAALTETVDDILIFATITAIDGPGRILGAAGPCLSRSESRFALIGVMRFDVADLPAVASSGRLMALILHEMLHVVGVGTIWRAKDALLGGGTQNPVFGGLRAAARCVVAGGPCVDGTVPVENTGNPGTVEAHWRESVFDNELMTGFAEPTPDMPFSAITLASLEDLGLVANFLAADAYVVPLPPPPASPRLRAEPPAPWELIELPRFEVTRAGWIRPVSGAR